MKAPHPPLGHPLPEHGERARGEGVGATQGLRPGLSSVAAPVFMDLERCLEKTRRATQEAASRGAKLVVFPET